MARKAATNSEPGRGFNDIIGVVLLAVALLLLVAQFSFDRNDLAINRDPPNHPTHNWIGPLGAWIAHKTFFIFGFSAYMVPILIILFGLAYLFDAMSYLKRRWVWAVVLILSCMGWLHLMDLPHLSRGDSSFFTKARIAISAPSIGGFLGLTMYGYFFWMLGSVGAGIVYGALDLISLLFLTNFQLGEWLRGVWGSRLGPQPADKIPPQEQALERRARDLQKQAKKLQEEADRSGLGADMQPVPEPTVRDLSVTQSKSARSKKPGSSEPVQEPAPADDVVVIPAKEVAAATTADVLGKKSETAETPAEAGAANKTESGEKAAEAKLEPEVHISGLPTPLKPKLAPRKP